MLTLTVSESFTPSPRPCRSTQECSTHGIIMCGSLIPRSGSCLGDSIRSCLVYAFLFPVEEITSKFETTQQYTRYVMNCAWYLRQACKTSQLLGYIGLFWVDCLKSCCARGQCPLGGVSLSFYIVMEHIAVKLKIMITATTGRYWTLPWYLPCTESFTHMWTGKCMLSWG